MPKCRLCDQNLNIKIGTGVAHSVPRATRIAVAASKGGYEGAKKAATRGYGLLGTASRSTSTATTVSRLARGL